MTTFGRDENPIAAIDWYVASLTERAAGRVTHANMTEAKEGYQRATAQLTGAVAPCPVCAQRLPLTQTGEVECPNCHERLRAGWLLTDAGGQ